MIFVTVGTEQYPFDRLMNWITILQQTDLIQDDIIVQYGSCTQVPVGVRAYKMLEPDEFIDILHQAQLVISHCGEGTLLTLEKFEKPYILVPRSRKLKEHVDNHQVEMAIALAKSGATIAWSPGDLVRFLSCPQPTLLQLPLTTAKTLCKKLHHRFESIDPLSALRSPV